ncbi:signal recognition particle-docking protein FtsY [Halanaerobium praevalens]|uniref:Signal recognition particle receptor FtsY n=1 Tax=Halanaerobium praevalens (strain ATCC 33744 / DSM 2228 / GSL) TaxID=572479 RepID=E3DRM7_HALPG|nr:signal recognition particle-docking protein FtsY [Halanaerobium praevalens]ADO77068.1 signal recognition particle-docking protein FtsY [Halanaerobium praevalens DSM 2228]
MGFLQKLKAGLKKTKAGFVDKVTNIFTGRSNIDDQLFEELEEVLIQADVGVKTTFTLIDKLKEDVDNEEVTEPEELMSYFQKELKELLQNDEGDFNFNNELNIIMMVGVNGAGKTTTIAKLAGRYKKEGKKVMLAAGDTFRAGAIEQLQIWGDRLGVNVISQQEGSDAAAVAYDAIQSAKAKDVDLLIVDTAGRLHTQTNLMKELKKVKRVIEREAEAIGAGVEVLLVLDATTGQNAISQAKLFNQAVNVDGVALTKLDGTAKGGIVITVKNELDIPIKLIGVGEAAEDLQNFDPEQFIEALFSQDE